MFNIVASQNECNDNSDVLGVAKKIQQEINAMPNKKSHYTPVTPDSLLNNCIKTLQILLLNIKPKFNKSFPAAMVGNNIVTSMTTGMLTPLQLSLGLCLHQKSKIEELHKYCVTSSYEEILRFTISASLDKQSTNTVQNIEQGLIQYVSNNFDTQMCSQNGIKQTHGLASVVTQPK